ncbi:MAG TPA: IS66 family transposase [Candidatus Baltobacteraceae bacterium]|nr:IS66 family transposase [Candidatus Dormibacteraeota bacterium]HVA29362.1 IS66 family transposase [Candidatus Baltobacteraceae bacterium]
MESANVTFPDLDGLNLAELKSLLREQHTTLQEQHALLLTQSEQLIDKDAQLISYSVEIEILKLQILKLRRMQFGNRSEKRAQQIEQLELWVEELESAEAQHSCELTEQTASTRTPSAPKQRRAFPAHLPRETQTIAPHESRCPDCDGELKHLGEDVTELLELEPVRFKVIRQVRTKLACAKCDTIVQAPAPTRPIERGMAGPGLLAHVLVGKYADHLPLYRQAEIYAREGVELDRTLLAQWVGNINALLTPLTDALRAHVFAAEVVHADDTPIPVLAPGRGKTKTGRLWTYVRDERPAVGEAAPAVWFAYTPDRKGEHPQRHLAAFTGVLQADGYAGYSKLYDGGRVREAACWAHVRRKFVDLHELHKSPVAGEMLDRVGALYAIEKAIRGRPPDERRAVRRERSRPALDAMHGWLHETLATLSQKSAMAKAIRYALTRWAALIRYCDDGRIEIDNNAAERALRCVALGRKNFLFAGSDAGGERAAAIYSLLGSAKLNGYNPEAFLREVLTRIADHPINQIAELLPWNLQQQPNAPTTSLAESGATPELLP